MIIAIGDELLSGRTIDTNSAWLSSQIDKLGFQTTWHLTVADKIDTITEAITRAKRRGSVCILSGGLGPTVDDVTIEAICKFFGRKLLTEESILDEIKEKYIDRGLPLPKSGIPNEALIPERATALKNSVGMAPGILIEEDGFILIALPGVPHELKDIFIHCVAHFLEKYQPKNSVLTNVIYTTGIAESSLSCKLEKILHKFPEQKIAFYPGYYGVEVRLTSTTNAGFKSFSEKIFEICKPWCYSTVKRDLPNIIGALLKKRNHKVSAAESCTGGLLSSRLVDVAGASMWFEGGVVSYSNDAKVELLGVEHSVLEKYGAVSGVVASQMARGSCIKFHADYGLSTTGIAGPTGESKEKPLGLVFYAVHSPEGTFIRSNIFAGGRESHRHKTSQAVLTMLWLILEGRYNNHIWVDGSKEFLL